MATVHLAVSGLSDGISIVQPLMPQIVSAFRPFGIDLVPEDNMVLAQDPEDQDKGWPNLISTLEQQSQMSTPAHLVVTNAPPGFDGTINGMLLHSSVRGVAAVYLGANIYQQQGPAQRPDLVTQVCIHELGHLLDLTHLDGGNDAYVNAMLPASIRQNQTVQAAWQLAVSDAQSRGEPEYQPPNPMLFYPFGAQCRACLRAASTDLRWLPFQGPFRGEYDGAGSNQDRMVHLEAVPHADSEQSHVGGGLYFTLAIENRTTYPIELPLHISPEHGALRVTAMHETGEQTLHRSPNVLCSDARLTLMPGERIHRSFALVGRSDATLFAAPGRHRCQIEVIDHHGSTPVMLGSATLDIDVRADADAEKSSRVLSHILAHRPGRLRRHEASTENDSDTTPLGSHIALARTLRRRSSKARLKALAVSLAPHVPTALRHIATREIVLHRIRHGEDWHVVAREMRRDFPGPLHEELHEAIRRTGEGWIAYQHGYSA